MASGPDTLAATLRDSCRTYAAKAAQLVPESGGYRTVTYTELAQTVRRYCHALQSLGLARGDRVALQSENCVEWAWTDWACQCLGIALVPIYPSLPADQAQYIASDAGAKLIVAGDESQAAKTAPLGIPIVQLRSGEDSLAGRAAKGEMSEEAWNAAIDAVGSEDLATIIYTSGTTGNPKGVMLPHRCPAYLNRHVIASLPVSSADTFFSFLPLSHVFERYAGHWLPISCGATIGYMKSLASMAADLSAVQPTIMLTVPRFLEAMQDRVCDSVAKQSSLKQKMFWATVSQGRKRAKGGFAPLMPLLDALVGKKVRARVGGRLRFFVSGGAALAPHTYEFWSAMGLLILQGYGLTETCAATNLNVPEDNKYWTVGPAIEGVEIKIADDGEILMRGPSMMDGYYNLPEATAEAIDADGWFHSGDIGEWEGRHLKITDRKKDLLILANGKNVAPQPIENKLKESRLIAEAVLFGDGSEYVYALIVPNFDHLRSELEKPKASNVELAADPAAAGLLKSEIDGINKGLADFERVKRHALLDAVFSVESGELTPSMKVRRKVVREKYADELAKLAR